MMIEPNYNSQIANLTMPTPHKTEDGAKLQHTTSHTDEFHIQMKGDEAEPAFIALNVYTSWHAVNLRSFTSTGMTCRTRLPSKYQHQTLFLT